jgi:hypothetical protein
MRKFPIKEIVFFIEMSIKFYGSAVKDFKIES